MNFPPISIHKSTEPAMSSNDVVIPTIDTHDVVGSGYEIRVRAADTFKEICSGCAGLTASVDVSFHHMRIE